MDGYYDERADWSLIPAHMREGIFAYVMQGRPMGGFLTLVFENDFVGAAGKADDSNRHRLFEYASFLYNHVPAECKGSPEAVSEWIEKGGIQGRAK